MEIKELLIIYLAAGAPFAVYYFFRHRRDSNRLRFSLNLLLRFFVWFPYALLATHQFLTQKLKKIFTRGLRSSTNKVLTQKDDLLREFISCYQSREFFEAKEIVERYVALTEAKNNFAAETARRENELFRIALQQNTKLAARCLHRKNREQVWRHQAQAQNDFYNLCSKNDGKKLVYGKICLTALALAKLLNDETLEKKLVAQLEKAPSAVSHSKLNSYHLKTAR